MIVMTHATPELMSAVAVSTRVPAVWSHAPEAPSAFELHDVTAGESGFCVPVSPEMVTWAAAAAVPVLRW